MTRNESKNTESKPAKHAPKVSVVTISYNQEKYIGAALDSFIMQQTDFDFEIIIADDCSTDKTPDIIRRYAKAHPHLFRPILRTKNLGAQANSIDSLRAARGDYIALCEGDDYWTDPTKLQRQADFLDNHPDYALCFHPVKVFYENKEEKTSIYPEVRDASRFTTGELLRWNFIQTNSVMFRRQSYDKLPKDILPLDWYLHLYHAQFGKIGFINRVMAAYRRHAGGIWWESYSDRSIMWKRHGLAHLKTYLELSKLYGHEAEYQETLDQAIFAALTAFIEVDKRNNEHLFKGAMAAYPGVAERFLLRKLEDLEAKEALLEKRERDILILQQAVEHKDELIKGKDELVQAKQREIAAIKASRIWKTRNKVAKLVGKKVL